MPTKSAALCLVVLSLAGCNLLNREGIAVATETDRAWCESLARTAPSRSRQDTAQTQAEIGVLYDFIEEACGGGGGGGE